MKNKNVILTGFMGSGKTTAGVRLSYRMRIPVEDTDKMIERREGRSVAEIFAVEGEAAFREKETALLRELADRKDTNGNRETPGSDTLLWLCNLQVL